MNYRSRLQRVFKIIGLALTLGVSMTACSQTRWKEEVLLHDGTIITAERVYNLGNFPGFDATERLPLDETVTFNLPNATSIIWKSDFRDAAPEPNSLNHFRFDIVAGIPYLATYPAGCIAYNKWGRPNPPQVLLKYGAGQWQRITFSELPPALINKSANVVVGRPATSLLKPFYTVADVNAKNALISTPEYKTILREPVQGNDAVTSCPDFNSQRYRSPKAPIPMK
ncbi:hypothetical protein [Polaromonas sp. AER18D-145]|uniref:hypothetical protein n=1 Tax=Polaromonas sp. AER18D-145 TaxID=1977060 RepID=UPI001141C6D5|nr:hypothetical protein [Polaromonas sp. AER18D-145]